MTDNLYQYADYSDGAYIITNREEPISGAVVVALLRGADGRIAQLEADLSDSSAEIVNCHVEIEGLREQLQQAEEALKDIAALEKRGDLQIKVTCGPHYERVKCEAGLQRGASRAGNVTPGSKELGVVSRGCLAGTGVLFVSHQGDVFPCGYLPVHCGNVLTSNLWEIWHHSKDLTQLSNSEALQGKCGVCGYKHVCGGCRARAYEATGDRIYLDAATEAELQATAEMFESRWLRWNAIRTVIATLTTVLLLVLLLRL